MEAVRKGTLAVGVRGADCVVLGVEKKSIGQTAGSAHDAQIPMIDHISRRVRGPHRGRAHFDRQSPPGGAVPPPDPGGLAVRGVGSTRYVGGVQQKFAERRHSSSERQADAPRARPRGRAAAVPTDPSGRLREWKANATGRNSKAVREWLEKHHEETEGEATRDPHLHGLDRLLEAVPDRVLHEGQQDQRGDHQGGHGDDVRRGRGRADQEGGGGEGARAELQEKKESEEAGVRERSRAAQEN